MKLLEPIDVARYSPRLWWLMLAAVAARLTAERPAAQVLGLLLWLVVLLGCLPIRSLAARGPHASVRVQQTGIVVALLGMVLAVIRFAITEQWQPALLMLLLAIQAGAFIAIARGVHVWLIVVSAFIMLLLSAAQTHSPLFLPCAACFTFLALGLLALEHRSQRQTAAAFEPAVIAAERGGGLLFAVLALLLAIPVYLFVPKPGSWLLDDAQATIAPEERETPAPLRAPAPPPIFEISPAPEPEPEPEPQGLPDDAPTSATAEPTPSSGHIARPERGDYGEDFGIADVERRRELANNIVLYARSSQAVNLRGRVYDRFAGNRWSRTTAQPRRLEPEAADSFRLLVQPAGPTRIEQSIEITLDLDSTLLHAPGLQRLRFPADALQLYEDGVLIADQPLQADTLYSSESRLTLLAGRYLLRELPPLDFSAYLQVQGASLRLRELAASVTAGPTSKVAKALALEQHLRTGYQYSYETLQQQNYTPLDWFLFESRRGHCEFFASALAMMLRSVGIASRVATGFSLGDSNPLTGFHEVRALDGHAWVEAYIEGAGWLMLEPTPFYPLPQPGIERQIAEQMDGYLDRLADTRELINPGTLSTQLTVLARSIWRGMRSGQRVLANTLQALGWMLPLVIAAIMAAVLGLYLLAVAASDWFDNLKIRRSLAELPAGGGRAAVLQVAGALVQMTTPRSFARRQDWSLREYSNRLMNAAAADQHSGVPIIPDEFIEAFDAARYGSADTLSTAGSLSKVTELVQEQLHSNPWPRLRAAVARLQRVAASQRYTRWFR